MVDAPQNQFSGPVIVFHERRLPEAATLAGYAALIEAYDLAVPIPAILSAIGARHRRIEQQGWRIFGPRYAPAPKLEGHLTFAQKHEGLDVLATIRVHRYGIPSEQQKPTTLPGTISQIQWLMMLD
jgi:hypothetical protein